MGKVILELTTDQLNQLQACVMDARLYCKLEARQDLRDAGMKITEVEDWETRCKESAARHLVEADQATALLEYLRDGWRIKRDDGPVVGGTPGKMYTDHGADESAAPAVEAPKRREEPQSDQLKGADEQTTALLQYVRQHQDDESLALASEILKRVHTDLRSERSVSK